MRSEEVRQRIVEIGIVPCARVKLADHARFAADSLIAAGIPVLEVPVTVAHAPEAIADIVARYPEMVVGAGTVLTCDEARQCIEAGARFITSPGFVPAVVACAKEADVVVFPGALTPSEIIAAWSAGADFVKIFPAGTAGGPNYVRAIKAPLPQVPLIVTGGVNQLTAFDYILAGAAGDRRGRRAAAQGRDRAAPGRPHPRAGAAIPEHGEGSAGAARRGVGRRRQRIYEKCSQPRGARGSAPCVPTRTMGGRPGLAATMRPMRETGTPSIEAGIAASCAAVKRSS